MWAEVTRAEWRGVQGIPLDQVVTDGLQLLADVHGVHLELSPPAPGVAYEIRA